MIYTDVLLGYLKTGNVQIICILEISTCYYGILFEYEGLLLSSFRVPDIFQFEQGNFQIMVGLDSRKVIQMEYSYRIRNSNKFQLYALFVPVEYVIS